MNAKAICLMTFVLVLVSCAASLAADYYVDSVGGSDGNPGTSPAEAWQSLGPVNSTTFSPGDHIYFKAGTKYTGQLKPQGLGVDGSPIVIDSYGDGNKPCIDANGLFPEAVLLYNIEYWEINNIEITNWTDSLLPQGKGVYIHINDFGTAHHIILKNLYIHDIRGDDSGHASGSGDGIMWLNEGYSVPSRFDDLVIEDCHIARCDLDGIWGWSQYWAPYDWYPSLNVVIRGNLVEDVGLHGIVPIGCDGALVEYNVLDGAVQKYPSGCGTWTWSCTNSIVQFNEARNVQGSWDGWAFDSDWNSENNIFQYNYSHDNQVGFMLVCTPAIQSWNRGCKNTIIRYNIGQNDGWGPPDSFPATFRIIGPCEDTYVYGNTIYIGAGLDIPLGDLGWSWQGWSNGNYFYNNIFYADGRANYTFGSSANNVFSNNVWYGDHNSPPYDPNAITADPMLVAPNTGGEGMGTLDGYKLQAGSPCIDAGADISGSGGRDFWGSAVPYGSAYDIGAHEYISAVMMIEAEVEITPKTLNLASHGRWIMCHIRLPEEYDVEDIDADTILLEGMVEADKVQFAKGNNVAKAKFERSAVQALLEEMGESGDVELTVTGELSDGTIFEGACTIKLLNKAKNKKKL